MSKIGKQKKKHNSQGEKLTGNALRDWYLEHSNMRTLSNSEKFRIEITGELAYLPILKNRKISGKKKNTIVEGKLKEGKSFLVANPDAMAKIKALDYMFNAIWDRYAFPGVFFSSEKIALSIQMSDKQKADRISVLETIQDWLEPQTKPVGRKLDKHGKKKSRGWGIGLIDDDKRVIGFSFKNKDFNNEPSDKAVIEISEWIPGQMVLKNGFWTCEKKAE